MLQFWLKNIITVVLTGVCLVDDSRDMRQKGTGRAGSTALDGFSVLLGRGAILPPRPSRKHLEISGDFFWLS